MMIKKLSQFLMLLGVLGLSQVVIAENKSETKPSTETKSHSTNNTDSSDYKSGAKEIGSGFGKVGKATGRSINKGFQKTGSALDRMRLKLKDSFTGEESDPNVYRKSGNVKEEDLKQAENTKPNNDNNDLLGEKN